MAASHGCMLPIAEVRREGPRRTIRMPTQIFSVMKHTSMVYLTEGADECLVTLIPLHDTHCRKPLLGG